MSTLSDVSQGKLGWVYPPQPQTTFIEEFEGIISGVTPLIQGQDYVDVVFGSSQPSVDWVLIEAGMFNLVDSTPLNVWRGVVTSKTTSGFRLQLNGTPDTGNYYVSWSIQGAFGYYLSGPTSGQVGVPSQFTVRLPNASTLTGSVVITPSDGGAGGTFAPTTVTLTAAAPSATFNYTPSSVGARSISTSNNRGLSNPVQVGFNSITNYTLSGPSSGGVGIASTNFTVALPGGVTVAGTVTVTPSDGGAGGTFTPATIGLTTGAPSGTFTYTPASTGAKTISVTNNGGLTDPVSLTYTAVTVMTDNFTGTSLLTAHTADTGQTWAVLQTGVAIQQRVASGSVYHDTLSAEACSSFTPDAANHEATITIIKQAISGAPEIGMWLRATIDATNPRGYMGRFLEGSGYQFYRLDAGVSYAQIGSNTAGSLSNGDTLRFTVSGTGASVTLTLYKNGTQVAQVTDSNASRITANGKVGIHLWDPANSAGASNYRIDKLVAL
jgi:hypothetical protein